MANFLNYSEKQLLQDIEGALRRRESEEKTLAELRHALAQLRAKNYKKAGNPSADST